MSDYLFDYLLKIEVLKLRIYMGFEKLLTGIGPVTSALPMRRSTD